MIGLSRVLCKDLRPKQREFARLNLNYTIMALQRFAEGEASAGRSRMPTI
jgi:hypothetical protein